MGCGQNLARFAQDTVVQVHEFKNLGLNQLMKFRLRFHALQLRDPPRALFREQGGSELDQGKF